MRLESRESYVEARDRLDETARDLGPDPLFSVADSLFAAADLLDHHGSVRRALADPSAPDTARSALVDGLFRGRLDDRATDLLAGMSRSRWASPTDIGDATEALGIEAVLAAAEAQDRLDAVQDELFRVDRLVARHPELRVALADPSVPADRKAELLRALLAERADPATLRLVTQVVTYSRGRTLEDGLELVNTFVARRRQRMLAVVETATPLTDEQRDRLAAILQRRYDRPVYLQVEVNPRVVGGFRVTVGDQVIDGSVATRLSDARRLIAGRA